MLNLAPPSPLALLPRAAALPVLPRPPFVPRLPSPPAVLALAAAPVLLALPPMALGAALALAYSKASGAKAPAADTPDTTSA